MTDRQTHTQLIANGNTEKSLQLLAADFPNDNAVILLNSQWKDLQKNKLMGLMDWREESLRQNTITSNLLNLLANLDFSKIGEAINNAGASQTRVLTENTTPPEPRRVFISYSHLDDDMRKELRKFLIMLERKTLSRPPLIKIWDDQAIDAGDELNPEIMENLHSANLILLLVSQNFLASRFCYDIEMDKAMERHKNRTARVIPIIIKSCTWHDTPFSVLLGVPKDGRPVKDHADPDKAWTEVAQLIENAVRKDMGI